MPGPMQFSANMGGFFPANGHMPATVVDEESEEDIAAIAPKAVRHVSQVQPAPMAPASPRNVVQLAKKRLSEVKKELRRMKGLEKERAELERLIAAAENKPPKVALVRNAK